MFSSRSEPLAIFSPAKVIGALFLTSSVNLFAASSTEEALSVKQINQLIEQQQELVLGLDTQVSEAKQSKAQIDKKIVDKRVEIKQLELAIKRSQSLADSDSKAKSDLRTATYKKRVAEIELDKLKKRQAESAKSITLLTEEKNTSETELFSLSEQLAEAEIIETEQKRAAEKKHKQQAAKKKKQKKKKARVATAKPKQLTANEKANLEYRQDLLRTQARAPNSSLANTMLLNTQAVALAPIEGKPNLGYTPKVKNKTGSKRYKTLGQMQHLGNSQYRFKLTLSSGKNTFRVEEYSYQKTVNDQDNGKEAWLILDARSVKTPEFTLVKL